MIRKSCGWTLYLLVVLLLWPVCLLLALVSIPTVIGNAALRGLDRMEQLSDTLRLGGPEKI